MSNHADALAQHAKAIGQLAIVKGIVDQGGGDFGQEHKSLMVTGREAVNDLLDVFIAAMKKVRDDEVAKRAAARAQMGLFDPDSDHPDVIAEHGEGEPSYQEPIGQEEDGSAFGAEAPPAEGVYWQVLQHSDTGERYAVQVRPGDENPDEPQVFGFVKLSDDAEMPAAEELPGLSYGDDPITLEILNDPNEPFGAVVRFGDEAANEPPPETKPAKKRRKKA